MRCSLCQSDHYTILVHFDGLPSRKRLCRDCFVLKIAKEEECDTAMNAINHYHQPGSQQVGHDSGVGNVSSLKMYLNPK